MDQTRYLVCPACEALNRIPLERNALAARCGRCRSALFKGQPAAATSRNFTRQVESNDIPVVVDFWAEWCGPCQAFAPVYARIAREFEPGMRFLKVDTEREPELAARYGVRSIPTLMMFRRGAIVAQQAGAMNAEQLRDWLRAYAEKQPHRPAA